MRNPLCAALIVMMIAGCDNMTEKEQGAMTLGGLTGGIVVYLLMGSFGEGDPRCAEDYHVESTFQSGNYRTYTCWNGDV